jgi:class 3 adenylate cyclase/HAMP domain-containing protein
LQNQCGGLNTLLLWDRLIFYKLNFYLTTAGFLTFRYSKQDMAQTARPRIRFPIGAKLIIIISSILVLSLGAITALVSFLIGADVRITAEDNNFTLNKRTALGVTAVLETLRSNTRTLLALHDASLQEAPAELFFQENPFIAAIMLPPDGRLVNRAFFAGRGLDPPGLSAFTRAAEDALQRAAAGEELLLNGSPWFGSPLLVFLFPWRRPLAPGREARPGGIPDRAVLAGGPEPEEAEGGEDTGLEDAEGVELGKTEGGADAGLEGAGAGAILFSPEALLPYFGAFRPLAPEALAMREASGSPPAGGEASFLVNGDGDALIYPDPDRIRRGFTLRDHRLVRSALESGNRSFQTMYIDQDGLEYFGAYHKLALADAAALTRTPSAAVFQGITAITWRNILISASVLALSMLGILLFSKTISAPVKALVRATALIEAGNYRLDLKAKTRDEIGLLTKSFIGMGYGLENFEKFTNKAVLRLARQGRLARIGENKMAAICFALIRDFSELIEGMEAKDVVGLVNSFLSRIVPCITGTGGVVDKFLTQGGVVVMAVWGAVESAEKEEDMFDGDPLQYAAAAVSSALMMRAVVLRWNAERSAHHGRGSGRRKRNTALLKIGCGINIGEVVAGQIGSDERMEYTVIGDAVNLAARIEGPNDLFDTDILITEHTRNLIGDSLIIEEMPGLAVKGKEKPLRVFSVVNSNDAERVLAYLDKLPQAHPQLSRRCVGPAGPRTMAELRRRWRAVSGDAWDKAEPAQGEGAR